MSDLEAEVARLRAENERLREAKRERGQGDEYAGQLNGGLFAQAASARREAQQYQIIQQQGLEANFGEVTPTSLDAAARVMRDMGLL